MRIDPSLFAGLGGWAALVVSLAAAAVVSAFAFRSPRPLLTWIAGALLAVALAAGAIVPTPPAWTGAPLVAVLGLVVAVLGGSSAATTALDLAMGGSAVAGLHGGIIVEQPPRRAGRGAAADGAESPKPTEVLRGGLTIGVLERLAAAGTILAGFPEGLAIVIAIKGVGRFTELESPEARERFIIGTFASLIWACVAALAVRLALS